MVKLSELVDGKSPLECLITFLRNNIYDFITMSNLQNHQFNDIEPLTELLEFSKDDNSNIEPSTNNVSENWNELNSEIDLMEDEIRSCLSNNY